MPDKGRIQTDKELVKMEKDLTRIYSRAVKEIGESWKEYMSEADKKLKPLQDAYEAAKKSGDADEIKRIGKQLGIQKREVTIMNEHYRAMSRELSEQLANVNAKAAEYINESLPNIYAINYNFTAKQIEVGTQQAVSFQLVNEQAVKNLVKAGDTSLLPQYTFKSKKDVRWNMQNINSEVLQGILQGESMDKIARRLVKVEEMNLSSAIRTARTIVNATENKARYDTAKEAENSGVIMKKEWIATGDNLTRDSHREAWDKYGTRENAIPLDEPFIVGGEEMMYAGDFSASAANRYNCRCATPHIPVGFTSKLPPEKRGSIVVKFNG